MRVITDDWTQYNAHWWERLYAKITPDRAGMSGIWQRVGGLIGTASVLELGCGMGGFSRHCKGRYVGVDWSRAAIARARRHQMMGRNRLWREFICSDVFEYGRNNPWAMFDYCVAFEIFEHMEKPVELVTLMLNHAATIFVSLPLGECGSEMVNRDTRKLTTAGLPSKYHYAVYEKDDIAGMFPGAEFLDVDARHILFRLQEAV